MPAVRELLEKINYTYLSIFIILLLIIFGVYYLWPRNPSSSATQTNALAGSEKKPEGFTPEQESNNIKGEIVLYYAMWCGYSRAFLPEWEKFEIFAKEKLPNIKVTRMRCEDGNETACSQKGIRGFPMVVMYPVGKPEVSFDKERTTEKLVEFVNENI